MLPKALNHVAWLSCPCVMLFASVVRLSCFMRVCVFLSCSILCFGQLDLCTNLSFTLEHFLQNDAKIVRNRWGILRTLFAHFEVALGGPLRPKSMFPKAFNASDAFTRCLERLQMASNAPKSSQPCGLAHLFLCRFVCFCRPPLLCYACLCSCLALFFALTNWTSAQTLVLH